MISSYHKTKHWNILFDFFLGAPTKLAQVFLHQKPFDWQLLVSESDHNQESHNQENYNACLANEDVNYSTNSELDALIQAWT